MTEVTRVRTPAVPDIPGASWSNCLKIGREVVVSGITARGPGGVTLGGDSVEGQARACFDKLFALLDAAGGHPGNVYKLVIYTTRIDKKDKVNAARKDAFSGTYPASTFVGATGFVFPDLLVEIDAWANLDIDLSALEDA